MHFKILQKYKIKLFKANETETIKKNAAYPKAIFFNTLIVRFCSLQKVLKNELVPSHWYGDRSSVQWNCKST